MTQRNLSMKQTHRHGEQICDCQGGDGQRSEGLGVCDWQMQATMHRMDQQDPTTYAAAAVASVVSDSLRPHRRQPTRLPHPWDSPGKNTGVGCHCLLHRNYTAQVQSPALLLTRCVTLGVTCVTSVNLCVLQFPHLQNEDNNSISPIGFRILKIMLSGIWCLLSFPVFFPVSNQTSFGCSLFSSLKNYQQPSNPSNLGSYPLLHPPIWGIYYSKLKDAYSLEEKL